MISGAVFSDCRNYRYDLWRIWNVHRPQVLFIGLNPSIADETENDPTVRRCIGFAQKWGYGGLHIANLFALRATQPRLLKLADDPVGPQNDTWLERLFSKTDVWVFCWGNQGRFFNRNQFILKAALRLGCQKAYFLRKTKQAQPAHPLFLPADTQLKPFHLFTA